jgi:hypothetical protein
LVVFGIAVVRGFRPAGLLSGIGLAMGGSVAAAVTGALMWMLITTMRTTPAIWESYLYLALLFALTGGLWWILSKGRKPYTTLFGVVGVWLLLALVTSVLAPGVSYLFTWPALAGALVMLVRPPTPIWPMLGASLVSLVVTVPIADVLFQMAQPRPGNPDSELIPVAGLVTGLAILVFALVHSVWRTTEDDSHPAP